MNMDEYNYYFGNLRQLDYSYMSNENNMKLVQKVILKNKNNNLKFGRNERLALIATEKYRYKTERYNKKLEEKTNRLECRQDGRTDRLGKVVTIFAIFALVAIVYFVAYGNIDLEVAFKLMSGK